MNNFNIPRLDWEDSCCPSIVRHCLCPYHNQGTTTLHQVCSHKNFAQSFPVTQCCGPWGPVGLARSLIPENNLLVGPSRHSRHNSLPWAFFHPMGANSAHSAHSICHWEGLPCSTQPVLAHECFSGGIHFPGNTGSSNPEFSEADQLSFSLPTYTSSSRLGENSLHTNPSTNLCVHANMESYQSAEMAALSPIETAKESEPICTRAVTPSLISPIELAKTAERNVHATSHNDATATLNTMIDSCSVTMPPGSPFSCMINDPLDYDAIVQELYDPLRDQNLAQNVENTPCLLSDEGRDEHTNNYHLSCSDELEESRWMEAFDDLVAESPGPSCDTTESPNASTDMLLDALLSTPAFPDTASSLDEPSSEPSVSNPEPASPAESTSMSTTSPLPSLHASADLVTNAAVEAIKTSELGEEGPVRALSCPFRGCNSKLLFTRVCDLNKHYRQHFKRFFCRVEGCPMSEQAALSGKNDGSSIGFALKKDRLRHETSHNPSIRCEICGKVFSRADNMQNHIQRIHRRYLLG
jgi:hypothetical protein